MKTDGQQIVYSSGAALGEGSGVAPDLYAMRPGEEPRVIFANQNRDSTLLPIAVHDSRYAFAEANVRLYQPNGWKLWFMATDAAQPVLVDETEQTIEVPSPLPIMSLSDRYLVWQAFHQTQDGPRSQLLLFDQLSGETRVLFSQPPDVEQFWFPDIDANRLVYGVVDYREPSTPQGIYLMDLTDSRAEPALLSASGFAVTPSIAGDWVVWKDAADVFNWGSIVGHNLVTGEERTLDFGQQASLNYPSVGNRFAAAWGADATMFFISDLMTLEPVKIQILAPDSQAGSTRPYVRGDLLVWAGIKPDDDSIILQWAVLPSR